MHCKDSTNIQEQNQISTKQRPIRILHVVGGMNRGGIETWLMHVLRHIDRDRFVIDFLVNTTKPCPYDDEVRTLGSQIISCPRASQPLLYGSNFKRILQKNESYDIVHSHVQHFNGYVLRLAKHAGVPIRIAHSHNDTSAVEAKASPTRKLYLNLMKWLISRHATIGLAASRPSAQSLFGSHWENDPRWRVLYCGVDLTPFRQSVDRQAIRNQLGIPVDAFAIGHVGRFEEQKNHEFILDIAALLAKKDADIRFLLVGDGPLRAQMQEKVDRMNLSDRVMLAGVRSDVPQLMLGAMDLFLLPSLHEGLPLVLMEAQAAGLPCILSNVITQEVEVVRPLMQRLSLSKSASAWSEALLTIKNAKPKITQTEAYQLVEQSSFNIHNSLKQLEALYLERSFNEV
ncbi:MULTISPECIES: glycosyltransferase family 1 protein [unclassified Microcoleus]|uniref:glycosyltransferase family 1 protein n=1 Tax=unclassified Microcoleus TaxID=2642155 RepID=UPI002FCF1071